MTSDSIVTLASQAEPKRPAAVTEAQHRHLKAFPACVISGATTDCQAHHIIDYDACEHIGRPELAADKRNFITLREAPGSDFHLAAGHLGSFQSINLHIIENALTWKGWTEEQIRNDPKWLAMKATRMKPVREWTDEDTKARRDAADAMFPKE